MTVGPGITPGLLTLPSFAAEAVPVAKRSRAMRIARNYRRWGITPRPENVATGLCGGGEFVTHIFRQCIAAFG
ncbi:Low-specificity L-threonine aldolase [Pseudomonas chlororaphis]|jgi:threonine aldolase|uniref:Low-specificity L-threonine aldolase n=1 Tax=Pseudomonas chlororaphis TaxID=587753 RepID=A0A3G7TVT5_9PSED|nr:Low-specificity L-threonine aldolase [Pseudomonas chlororaphis]